LFTKARCPWHTWAMNRHFLWSWKIFNLLQTVWETLSDLKFPFFRGSSTQVCKIQTLKILY
jgi:hypothetical protein